MADRTITIDFNAPVRLADAPALARRVAEWWLGELKELAPPWLGAFFPQPPQTATLLVQHNTWRVISRRDEARAIELDPGQDDKGIADQILQAAPDFSLQRLTVVLPQTGVLRRRIELPTMHDADVRSAIELQIDRLSPFKPDAVRFAARVIARDAVEGKLTADIAIAPRAHVEAIERRLGALGFMPVAIDIDNGNGEGQGFDLRAPQETATPRKAMMINAGLVCGAALMWYLAVLAWDTAREREVEAWQTHVGELRPLAQRSANLRRQLDAMAQPFAIAQLHKPGLTLQIVTELTSVLPGTARLTELKLIGDTVELTGLANDAPALVQKLETSKLFKEVKFRSPVTRRPELNKERFEMALRLEQAPAK